MYNKKREGNKKEDPRGFLFFLKDGEWNCGCGGANNDDTAANADRL